MHDYPMYRDVKKELAVRLSIDEWLGSKGIRLTPAAAIIFQNASLGIAHMLEDALMRRIDSKNPPAFMFRRYHLDDTARYLCGRGKSLQTLEQACSRAAANSHLGQHPSVITEAGFLLTVPSLTKKQTAEWNQVMDGAYHRYEPAIAIQYDVDVDKRDFEGDRTYSWDFLQTVYLFAVGLH